MHVHWLLFMKYSGLLPLQFVNFSLTIYLTEIWHPTLMIHLTNFTNRGLCRFFYPRRANWMKLRMNLTLVLDEEGNLSDAITKLSFELSITKNVKTLFPNRLFTVEWQCWANAQFSRRECLDNIRIPRKVSGKVLEVKVLSIFFKLSCSIFPDHFESCHRISKKSHTFPE